MQYYRKKSASDTKWQLPATDVYSIYVNTIYCGFAFSKLVCECNEQINIT